ncbi:MAG: DUF484 family protein [Proteobacteria bacterium]|nr:MAG: DUF484 family protein [Pseudomonadota bacterium]QKK10947.1 MAG: DUF484 family protein [Pseudomonadota bacterium]
MSTQQQREEPSEEISESLVAGYLARHPDFFANHPNLLSEIQLSHNCGSAVSLIEHQVEALRAQNRQLRNKLMELVDVARDNDRTNERLHRLSVALLGSSGPEETVGTLNDSLREVFGADAVTLRIFGDPDNDTLGPYRVARDDLALVPFVEFFRNPKPQCGRLKPAQLEYLFGDRAAEIKSAALIPLAADEPLGFLAVGSCDAERFLLAMGTIFLARLGELIGYLLKPHVA